MKAFLIIALLGFLSGCAVSVTSHQPTEANAWATASGSGALESRQPDSFWVDVFRW